MGWDYLMTAFNYIASFIYLSVCLFFKTAFLFVVLDPFCRPPFTCELPASGRRRITVASCVLSTRPAGSEDSSKPTDTKTTRLILLGHKTNRYEHMREICEEEEDE